MVPTCRGRPRTAPPSCRCQPLPFSMQQGGCAGSTFTRTTRPAPSPKPSSTRSNRPPIDEHSIQEGGEAHAKTFLLAALLVAAASLTTASIAFGGGQRSAGAATVTAVIVVYESSELVA